MSTINTPKNGAPLPGEVLERRAKDSSALRKLIAVGNLMALALEMGPDAPQSTRDGLARIWALNLGRIRKEGP